MKKLVFINLLLLSTASIAQDFKEMNRWSVGASIGGHDGFKPTGLYTKVYQIHHFGVNGRYMVNNRFGVMADLGYDFIDATNSGPKNVNYLRASLQGVVNLANLMRFDSWSPKFGFLFHAGGGLSTMWCPHLKVENPKDKYLKNTDDMVNFMFGFTPQYKINEKIAVNADFSAIMHAKQGRKFDYTNNKNTSINGYFFNWSVGVSYALGTKEKHADWTPTVYGSAPQDFSKYEAMIKELQEKTKDDDMDGVPNYADVEPTTPKESFVDSKGVALKDQDQDGIADQYDLCPDVKGTFSMNGCLDSDADGIADNVDACPKIKGLATDNGCPVIPKDVKTVMAKALKDVQFENNKDVLLKTSFTSLNDVVKVMKANPNYKLKIEGHTDNVGDDNANMILSEKRASACAKYLISKGIDSSRFEVQGYGETKPVATNDTKAGKALNRRVEFIVVFN
jgi:OOP family OmpA-OmpF porin